VLLGEIDGCLFYIDRRLDEAWHQDQFILDVAAGEPRLLPSSRRQPALRHPYTRLRTARGAGRGQLAAIERVSRARHGRDIRLPPRPRVRRPALRTEGHVTLGALRSTGLSRRDIDRVRWGRGRRSLLACRYLTSGGIRTGKFLSGRDEPGGCPPTGQAVSGMAAT